MNWWGVFFIFLVFVAVYVSLFVIWLDERQAQRDARKIGELQDQIDQEYHARLLQASGGIRAGNVVYLDEYRRQRAKKKEVM